MSTFDLKIVTPESNFYSGAVEYLSLDTSDGSVGFMRGALPRISLVKRGKIMIRSQTLSELFYCGDGIVRVDNSGVTVAVAYCSREPVTIHGDITDSEIHKRYAVGGKEYKYAKAQIISAIKSMKDKEPPQ